MGMTVVDHQLLAHRRARRTQRLRAQRSGAQRAMHVSCARSPAASPTAVTHAGKGGSDLCVAGSGDSGAAVTMTA